MSKVIIVGAGPAGATLAYLLARAGIDVTLLERETNFERVFRGEAMMPLGLEALEQMGIDISPLPHRRVDSWDMHVANRLIFRVAEPQAELGSRAVCVLSQPAFLTHVTTLAQQFPNFRLLQGATMRDLGVENGRFSHISGTHNGQPFTQTADLIIGCDGRGSIVRTRADIKLNLLPESYDVLWFRFPAPPALHGKTSVYLMGSVRNTALAYNSHDDHIRYALLLPKGGYDRQRNWADELAEPAPPWLADHLQTVRGQIGEPSKLNVIVGRAASWHKPGLLLLGDAAHPMSPIRAQGINLALRDVIVAANHLIPALQTTDTAIDQAAARIAAERLPEIQRAQALQLREARGQMNERWKPLLIAIAKTTAPLVGRYQWAQTAWLNQQHPLRFGTVPVKLRPHPQLETG
ncbi:MAG: FAD-dependent monooxygenase [Anaerolineales bacterium]|nr:FAD-dependent monooxygenase [Anaerolineales bacterium]